MISVLVKQNCDYHYAMGQLKAIVEMTELGMEFDNPYDVVEVLRSILEDFEESKILSELGLLKCENE